MKKRPSSWDEFLPPELVSRIFKLALEDDIEAGSTSVDSSALLLGRVSKRWRDIAYSTPALWTSVHLNVKHAAAIPRLVSGIRAWLLRAGALPLSVQLDVSRAFGENLPQIALLTGALLSFSPQIRRLSIWINYTYTRNHNNPQDCIVLSDGGFPILETLALDCPFDRDRPDAALAKILASAPALRELSISNYPGTISVLPVPLAQLKRLVCETQEPPKTARDMLRRAPVLEVCRFRLAPSTAAAAAAFSNEVTTHRWLRLLQISVGGLEEFLSGLTLPTLTHITFDGASPISLNPWPQPSVAAFFARSQCVLEELFFERVNMTPRDLEACVEVAGPALKVLCIDGGPDALVRAGFLRRLTAPPAGRGPGDVLCPRLERLMVRGGVLEREGYGTGMLDMLESRFYRDAAGEDGVARLREAVVTGTFGPSQRKRVDKLKKDGMDLVFVLEGNRFA